MDVQKLYKFKLNVLVVDDEKELTYILQKILELKGSNVFIAHDGEEALSIYTSHPNYFDLIISDSLMPKMGGEELFKKVEEINYDKKPICLLTSGGGPNFNSSAVNGFIEKPFSRKDIREKLLHFFKAEVL